MLQLRYRYTGKYRKETKQEVEGARYYKIISTVDQDTTQVLVGTRQRYNQGIGQMIKVDSEEPRADPSSAGYMSMARK